MDETHLPPYIFPLLRYHDVNGQRPHRSVSHNFPEKIRVGMQKLHLQRHIAAYFLIGKRQILNKFCFVVSLFVSKRIGCYKPENIPLSSLVTIQNVVASVLGSFCSNV
jgi:hypothetical protein